LKVVEAADLMDIKTQNVNTAVTKLPFGREEWTSTFNVTKGPLGIALTELHFPRKKRIKGLLNVFNRETEYAPVVIGSVDPLGQGVKQDRRIRPGLVAKAVQGRLLTGMRAKDVIKVLEGEILARSDTEAMQEAGLSDLIAITFSSECVALPSEPDYCFNSVMDKDSVVGLTAMMETHLQKRLIFCERWAWKIIRLALGLAGRSGQHVMPCSRSYSGQIKCNLL